MIVKYESIRNLKLEEISTGLILKSTVSNGVFVVIGKKIDKDYHFAVVIAELYGANDVVQEEQIRDISDGNTLTYFNLYNCFQKYSKTKLSIDKIRRIVMKQKLLGQLEGNFEIFDSLEVKREKLVEGRMYLDLDSRNKYVFIRDNNLVLADKNSDMLYGYDIERVGNKRLIELSDLYRTERGEAYIKKYKRLYKNILR